MKKLNKKGKIYMKRYLLICATLFLAVFTEAKAGLIKLEFGLTIDDICDEGCNFSVDINDLDTLRKGSEEALDAAINQIKAQAEAQGIGSNDIENLITNLENTGDGFKGSEISLIVAGERVTISISDEGAVNLLHDDFGLFEGMNLEGLTIDNLEDFLNGEGDNSFAKRLESHIKELEESGKLYAILSKTFVKEMKRKIKDTGTSTVGGNPLSTMYSIADTDFDLAINTNKIDSYSLPQVYFANISGADIVNFRLPLNLQVDLFGLLDPFGVSFRFDLPISITQISRPNETIIGGNLGFGIAIRWILPEAWGAWTRDWTITPSYRPVILSASFNDRMSDMDEDAIMAMEDLSILPEVSVFKSWGITSKKDFAATQFGWENDKVKFTLIDSLTFVNSWSKSDIQNLVDRFGIMDEKTKQIIPELDLHNTFFKNGIFISYTPINKLIVGGGLTYTMVFGSTKVYVPQYWTLNLDVAGDIDLWIFDTPTLRLNYTIGANGWSNYGLALRLNF